MPAANALYKHILDSSYWLSDTDVNAALNLIKAKFPLVLGLHDTLLGAILDFPKQTSDRWVQVIHDNVNHWVVAAKVEKNHVFVYDSLGGDPNNHVLGCISSLLRPSGKHFSYIVKSCQKQENTDDCGLFAIAFAVTLASGQNPSLSSYSPSQLRPHLVNCLQKNEIVCFPQATPADRVVLCKTKAIKKERVYCHCRRVHYEPKQVSSTGGEVESPWDAIKCTSCKEWFHRQCETWPQKTWGIQWKCKNCLLP